MLDPSVNFASGLLNGANQTLSILDRLDERKRRSVLDKERQEDRSEMKSDRQAERERLAMLDKQALEDRERNISEMERQVGRQERQDERAEELFPLEKQLKQAQMSAAYSQQDVAKMQARHAEQAQRAQQAQRIAAQASTLARAGDMEGAQAAMQQLAGYGIDVPTMNADGAAEARAVMEGLMAGDLKIMDPEVQAVAKRVLTPSLVMSGRDMERYEFGRLLPSDNNGFHVSLNDLETGKEEPATLNASADDDELVELSVPDLMNAMQSYIADAEALDIARIDAAGVRAGGPAPGGLSSLDARKAESEIGLKEAQATKALAEAERALRPSGGRDGESVLTRSLEDFPGLKGVAQVLDSQGVSGDEAIDTISRIRRFQDEHPGATPGELVKIDASRQEIALKIQQSTAEYIEAYPEIDPEEIAKVVTAWQKSEIDAKQVQARIDQLQKRIDDKKKREQVRAEKQGQDARRVDDADMNLLDDIASEARGY